MKIRIVILMLFLVLYGCSSYTELSPDPEITPAELGYIELKNDDEHFELETGEKYYVQFPAPANSNFYLVLKLDSKSGVDYYFSDFFDDGEGDFNKITDEFGNDAELSVYKINPGGEFYYWVIDNVRSNKLLTMDYRYVPQWRFKFENRYETYKTILDDNRIDRSIYNAIDENYNLSGINYSYEIGKLKISIEAIGNMEQELIDLKSLFPSNISSSSDPAYQNYRELTSAVEDELQFQRNYLAALEIFQLENRTAGNTGEFVSNADKFLNFINNNPVMPSRIINKAKNLFAGRLDETYEYLNNLLKNKYDTTPINLDPPIEVVRELYEKSTSSVPLRFTTLCNFVSKFNQEAEALMLVNDKLIELDNFFNAEGSWPSNLFYPEAIRMIKDIIPLIPRSELSSYSPFSSYRCTSALQRELINVRNRTNSMQDGFQVAKVLVPRINELKLSRSYKNIITVLNQNRNLDFLLKQYPDLDMLALNQHRDRINSFLAQEQWAQAEEEVKKMFHDQSFIFYSSVRDKKISMVRDFENKIFTGIKKHTRETLEKFAQNNFNNVDNVEQLYQGPVFRPVHVLTFSSYGEKDLERKKLEISDYIENVKHNSFPEISINSIYKDFLRNKSRKGVEKCRAIVVHGNYYRGNDRRVKNIVDECNPQVPKWITKAKEYRVVNALPVTSNPNGNNEYLFKVQLQIPTNAEFPVYDINIKLPKEVADNASSAKWYKTITLDGKEIKNEGRIQLTAPTADNNYEFQVSPVQMDKEGRNILEVRFDFPAFKVLEVSTMAQRPIMKRN
ncbi:MAG: hypothetical protein SCALA702_16720 [Melioribacteraceae bacterium]|nr:MAG: hypothetical protein SCALA702_16720 [Melioribacteraceae bacterium]